MTNKPTFVHVNQHHIRHNTKCAPADRKPPITVRKGRKREYANEISIDGPVELIYSADQPILDCGARLVLRTFANVEIKA